MTFRKAREIFAAVQEAALANNDSETEGIAAGLIELTKALSAELKSLESKINSVAQDVRRQR